MQQRSAETRTHIMDAALKLFSQSGYNATGVAEICIEAGVSKGAFYHHFPTKQAVFLELLENWLKRLDMEVAKARENTHDTGQVFLNMTSMIPGIFQSADQRLPMFLEFWAQASRDPAIWQVTIAPYRRYRDFFAGLIEQGIVDGTFKPVEAKIAAYMIVSLAVGMLLQGLLDAQSADWQQVATQSMKILMDGLAKTDSQ
jgi:AcrR family transcriptional regulator